MIIRSIYMVARPIYMVARAVGKYSVITFG